MPQPAYIAINGDPLCDWTGAQAGIAKVKAAQVRDPGASCTCGHRSTASAERSARALRPEFKSGVVKVVKGFCPNHRIGQ